MAKAKGTKYNWEIADTYMKRNPELSWTDFMKACPDAAKKLSSDAFYSRKYTLKSKGLLKEVSVEKVPQPFLVKPADILATPSDNVNLKVEDIVPLCRKASQKYYKKMLPIVLANPTITALALKQTARVPINENSILKFIKLTREKLGLQKTEVTAIRQSRKTDNALYLKLCFIPMGKSPFDSTQAVRSPEATAVKAAVTQLVDVLVTRKLVNLEVTEVILPNGEYGLQVTKIDR